MKLNTKIKIPITLILFLSSFAIFAQRFDIVSAEYNDGIIQVEGEVFIDVSKKSIALTINDKEMTLNKITFKKGDIGELFPPSNNKWKNADSSLFLKHASAMLKKERGKINNIDTVIICENPKILDYSKEIRTNIAKILEIDSKNISIKGKTSESIGFIGRHEGIDAMAITSAQIPEITF